MQAVFLKREKCEKNRKIKYKRVFPVQRNEEEIFYSGMEDISSEENDIYIAQYLRTKEAQLLSIGFLVRSDKKVSFRAQEETFYIQYKTEDPQYRYYIMNNFNLTVPGDKEIFYETEGKEHIIRIHVVPTIKDNYEKILKDLTNISIRLYYASDQSKKNKRIKREYLTDYEIEIQHLSHHIGELAKILRSLSQDPMADMISKPAKRPFRQVKHLDANAILDHYVLHKPKVRTKVHEKTLNIYENQKIYSFIELLEQRLKELDQEIREKEQWLEEESGIVGQKSSLEELRNLTARLRKGLQKTRSLEMFQKEKFKKQRVYPLKSSNLFVNHKKYKQAFRLMQDYREIGELLESNKQYVNYGSTSRIYEIWCYFKIMEIFMLEYGYEIDRISWPEGKKFEGYYRDEKYRQKKGYFLFKSCNKNTYKEIAALITKYIKENQKTSLDDLDELVIHMTNENNDIYLGYNCAFKGKSAKKAGDDYTTHELRPDIFLLINKENFFACDAKYKNYRSDFQGIQEWYVDLFECAAHKYIYRLDLGNDQEANDERDFKSVKARFKTDKEIKPVLKNGGTCILTPAIADKGEARKIEEFRFRLRDVERMFAEYLKLLDEGKVNRNLSTGNPEFDPKEYSENLKNDIMINGEEKYEYHIASVRFLPGECKEFKHLFKSAIKYNEAEFN